MSTDTQHSFYSDSTLALNRRQGWWIMARIAALAAAVLSAPLGWLWVDYQFADEVYVQEVGTAANVLGTILFFTVTACVILLATSLTRLYLRRRERRQQRAQVQQKLASRKNDLELLANEIRTRRTRPLDD